MTNLPTGTVTFLFTDIEGSTKLAQGHPDKWEALRARHHAILQSAVESHNGYVFQIIGDAFCVIFHTAGDALRAAVRSQTDLHNEAWGDMPIKVRMGIHTGKAEVQANGEYHGYLVMSRVQRLMSAAHGGQVLISLATEELIRDELPENISLRDMGERRLKDLIRPERIYQLVIPNLPVDFPPIKTLDVYRHNLPAQTTSFIGREKEMAEIKNALTPSPSPSGSPTGVLREGEVRLVTLTGSGGTGKTRLSLQVAADLLDQFPDGVWFIELAPLTNPDLISQTILSALGVGEQEAEGKTATLLIDHVRNKKLLLVLDNCEHLIEACAQLADSLLSHAPSLKILASSREALGVRGEMAWHVPSLALPDIKHLPDIESLSQYEAIHLFMERATLAQPHFHLTKDNASSVAQICSRLDGIPLAIELAAARVKALSVDQIAARLNDRFRLLTGGARTALPRQQTLRALIEWSYNLLSEQERVLFARLAVFVGGWRLEAAEQVCVEERSGLDILDLLSRLVDKSLVNVEETKDGLRYRMLETTRQFARDMLMMSDQVLQFRERHLAYYLRLVESAEPELRGRNQAVWLTRLELEHDNLRAALEWSLESQPESGLRMAVGLSDFWDTHGHVTEGYKWLDAMLNATGHLAPTPTRVEAIFGAAGMAMRQTDIPKTQMLLSEGIALAQALGNKNGIAKGLAARGLMKEHVENDLEGADALYNESLEMWREVGDKLSIGQGLGPLAGRARDRQHDYALADSLYNESLALFREVGNEREIAGAYWNLSEVAIARRDYDAARRLAEESLALYRDLEDKHGVATALRAFSVAVHNQGHVDQARRASEESVELFREIGDRGCLGFTLLALARQVYTQNNLQRAAELIQESVAILHETGEKVVESNALNVSGRITLAQGNPLEAQNFFRDGLTLQRDLQDIGNAPSLLEGLANTLASLSQIDDALRLMGAAEALRERINVTMMQVERPEYDQLVSMMREQMDEATYQKMWDEGRAMLVEQAIDLALS
ncbi:MAG TPA: tetratricopeptide repeat protein [Anaerolineales bacterium]|nr:tetratricopeptide repeat protein [Anaerolineales bacterium]